MESSNKKIKSNPIDDNFLDSNNNNNNQLSSKTITEFTQLNLDHQLLKNLHLQDWHTPTEVQSQCLPHCLNGYDLLALAQTGTGKTGVFLITIAQAILTHKLTKPSSSIATAIILAPTRELAMQIYDDGVKVFKNLNINSSYLIGGVDFEKQKLELKSKKPLIIIATPGRLIDFVKNKIINLNVTKFFVCDEVDRMLDIGFFDQVNQLMTKLPPSSHKMMFSATMSDEIQELCFKYLNSNAKLIFLSQDDITPEKIIQKAIMCSSQNKLRVFIGLILTHKPKRAIVFTNTKINAVWLHQHLIDFGFAADLITGDLPQKKRISLIKKIKSDQITYLIATDVASRGLHIPDVTHVYNFDLPQDPANYIHRIGRTARAGSKGYSYSLVCDQYAPHLLEINQLLKEPMRCQWYPKSYLFDQNLPKKVKVSNRSTNSKTNLIERNKIKHQTSDKQTKNQTNQKQDKARLSFKVSDHKTLKNRKKLKPNAQHTQSTTQKPKKSLLKKITKLFRFKS